MNRLKTKDFVLIALLIGLNVVLARIVSINAWNIKIGFTFLTIYIGAYLYGPIGAAFIGGLGDVIGSLLFPTGPFYPAFTLTAIIEGLLFGFVLNKNNSMIKIVLTTLVDEFLLTLLLNTYWISILFNANFKALLITRLFQSVIMFVVETISIKLLSKSMPKFERRLK